ncbi:cupin domain-containing protein [Pseudonocardia sp. ICBG601]|uniref:cupin domain-containing protein n=1 Tax=Pseudonocardia sp. ICBG601 TaxID=2846759 RepID=UPI001CF70D1B|nr:cupin domain-containing protein [Pseudonocardia sp. ICBG601]
MSPACRRSTPRPPGSGSAGLQRAGLPLAAAHHGEAETGGYVLKGTGRIWYGENYAQWIEMNEGDFVFVPPFMPHVEGNMSTTEELVWLTCRTPDNIVVNLPEVDDASLEGYRRA